MCQPWGIWVALLVAACPAVFGAAMDEAAALRDEALGILKAANSGGTDPKTYATALVKLERAQKLLEQANAEDSALAQEVGAALFWARKFSNIHSMNAVADARRNPPETKTPSAPEPPDKKDALSGLGGGPDPARLAAAKRTYEEAERFASSHAGNDYIVALRWFKVADQLSGTGYATKALANARAAQERYAARTKAKEADAKPQPKLEGPEYDLIREGDALLAAGKFDAAVGRYEVSAEMKDTILAHRKLGHALFNRAQAVRDELMPKFEVTQREYKKALAAATKIVRGKKGKRVKQVNWKDKRLVEAWKRGRELTKQAYRAIEQYDRAAKAFSKVLSMSEGGEDLDAAGHRGLCYSARGDRPSRKHATILLTKFLKDYQPLNDMERTLYEFCRTELKRISK